MPSRRTPREVVLPHTLDATLPDGRRIEFGQEFSVHGQSGRFRFAYVYDPDGSITAWGPVNNAGSQDAQWRSFRPERVKTIHRLKKEK